MAKVTHIKRPAGSIRSLFGTKTIETDHPEDCQNQERGASYGSV